MNGDFMILRLFRLLTFVKCCHTYTSFFHFASFSLKKDTTLLPGYLTRDLPGGLPSDLLGYLMLPNLTNQFIKLSDGDLQCE